LAGPFGSYPRPRDYTANIEIFVWEIYIKILVDGGCFPGGEYGGLEGIMLRGVGFLVLVGLITTGCAATGL
jgi:hypothetical protein